MGSQQPFPLSKLIFMFVKSLAAPLSRLGWFQIVFNNQNDTIVSILHICSDRRLLQRAKTDTLFRWTFTSFCSLLPFLKDCCVMIKTMIMIVSLQEIDCSPPCPPLPLLWGEDQVQSDEPWKGFYTQHHEPDEKRKHQQWNQFIFCLRLEWRLCQN